MVVAGGGVLLPVVLPELPLEPLLPPVLPLLEPPELLPLLGGDVVGATGDRLLTLLAGDGVTTGSTFGALGLTATALGSGGLAVGGVGGGVLAADEFKGFVALVCL